ncbi:MAG: hypothetical protein HC910_22185 [Spirulinaceae cyanobacterium SM2_1_0]|nr:hypothetical protein [Spirulinaceae cyanobacterium SM2_1_0]
MTTKKAGLEPVTPQPANQQENERVKQNLAVRAVTALLTHELTPLLALLFGQDRLRFSPEARCSSRFNCSH